MDLNLSFTFQTNITIIFAYKFYSVIHQNPNTHTNTLHHSAIAPSSSHFLSSFSLREKDAFAILESRFHPEDGLRSGSGQASQRASIYTIAIESTSFHTAMCERYPVFGGTPLSLATSQMPTATSSTTTRRVA